MNLYPEMNKKIIGILKTGEGHCLYAAARIEQLEAQLIAAQELCKIYFDIAAAEIGEDEVRSKRDEAIKKASA